MKALVSRSCPTLCDSMECSPPGSSVHGILQARILEWVAMPFSRGSSRPRDHTQVSCIAGRFFTVRATREALCKYVKQIPSCDSEMSRGHPKLGLKGPKGTSYIRPERAQMPGHLCSVADLVISAQRPSHAWKSQPGSSQGSPPRWRTVPQPVVLYGGSHLSLWRAVVLPMVCCWLTVGTALPRGPGFPGVQGSPLSLHFMKLETRVFQ